MVVVIATPHHMHAPNLAHLAPKPQACPALFNCLCSWLQSRDKHRSTPDIYTTSSAFK